jgi:hypothetical protein
MKILCLRFSTPPGPVSVTQLIRLMMFHLEEWRIEAATPCNATEHAPINNSGGCQKFGRLICIFRVLSCYADGFMLPK